MPDYTITLPGGGTATADPEADRLCLRSAATGATLCLDIIKGSLTIPRRGGSGKYKCMLRCFIRSGRRFYWNGAVESAYTFSFTVKAGSSELTDLAFDGYAANPDSAASPAAFNVTCDVPNYEENGTPLAEQVGLVLGDDRRSQPVKITLQGDGSTIAPVFKRDIFLGCTADQILTPFQFFLRGEKLRSVGNRLTWFRQPR